MTGDAFKGLAIPEGGFRVIGADPPWSFQTWSKTRTTPHRGANEHYKVQPREWLSALPVASLAAKDSALLMWSVSSHLDEAIDLMRAWGFKYKSIAFWWTKTGKDGRPRMSMGYYTRQEGEIVILGTRGKPKVLDHGVRQVIMAPRREHSRKPNEWLERTERLFAGPRIELFARQSRPQWASWGDERGRFDAEHSTPDSASQRGAEIPAWCSAGGVGALCRCDRCALRRLEIRELIKQLRHGKRPSPT